MRKITVAAAATLALLTLSTPALAHVTVQPTEAPTGSFSRFDVRVPNEQEDADTTRVEVQFPDVLTNVNFQPKSGWERSVTMKTLDEPIEVFGREVTEVIDTVTWEGGAIAPGEFDEFGFTARTPDTAEPLTFPAIQTYGGSEEVAWIGDPDSDAPAPVVQVNAVADAATEDADTGDDSESEAAADAATEAADAATEEPDDTATAAAADVASDGAASEGGGGTQSTIALVLAVLALVVAVGGALAARRSS